MKEYLPDQAVIPTSPLCWLANPGDYKSCRPKAGCCLNIARGQDARGGAHHCVYVKGNLTPSGIIVSIYHNIVVIIHYYAI